MKDALPGSSELLVTMILILRVIGLQVKMKNEDTDASLHCLYTFHQAFNFEFDLISHQTWSQSGTHLSAKAK